MKLELVYNKKLDRIFFEGPLLYGLLSYAKKQLYS